MDGCTSEEVNEGATLLNGFVHIIPNLVYGLQLTSSFINYGKEKLAGIVCDPHPGNCRGFAFIRMMFEKDAQKAIDD